MKCSDELTDLLLKAGYYHGIERPHELPTLSAAQLWVWKKFGLWVVIDLTAEEVSHFTWHIEGMSQSDYQGTHESFDDPSIALEAGILAALENAKT